MELLIDAGANVDNVSVSSTSEGLCSSYFKPESVCFQAMAACVLYRLYSEDQGDR